MSGGGYFTEPSDGARPAAIRVLRVLLWADCALTAVLVLAGMVATGASVQVVAHLLVMAWPGAVAGVVAWRLARPCRPHIAWPLSAAAWQTLLAISNLLGGDPRGLTSLLLPLSIAALLATPPVRRFVRDPGRTPYDDAAPGRSAYNDAGASALEYVGLITFAALILGGLAVLGLPNQVGTSTQSALCRILATNSCGPTPGRTHQNDANPNGNPGGGNPSGGSPNGGSPNSGTPDGGAPNGGWPNGDRPGLRPCHGVLDCAWQAVRTDPHEVAEQVPCNGVVPCIVHGAAEAASSQWNLDKAIVDDAKGIVDLVTNPGSLADAGKYIWDHPGTAARQLVWDDESAKEWSHGNYVGAVSRTIWNVGSWLIPGGAIGKTLSKAGKFGKLGKLGKLADKTGKLGRLARSSRAATKAADKAKQLAAKGDAKGARKAATHARRYADAATRQARSHGCAVALQAISTAGVLPHFGRFGAAALPACARGESEEARKARRAADQADKAAKHFIHPPEELDQRAFPGTARAVKKTPRQGGSSLRSRWKDRKGRIYEWDYQHGTVEKYTKKGKHLGEYDPHTGEQMKPAVPGRRVEP